MDDGSQTLWDLEAGAVPPEAVAERVVRMGLLDAPRAAEALRSWRAAGPGVGFTTWLMDAGLIGIDAVQSLQEVLVTGAARHDPQPGERASGCVLVKKLGQGGMGIVFLAHREADGAKVVVKFLAQERVHDVVWRTRFIREALLVKHIDHPNVVAVYSVDMDSPRPHIVMELVEGEDLEDRLTRSGRLPPLEAARIGRDVARALAAAHAAGVIHRDIKPGNVRLTTDGRVKVLDFGLAKSVESDAGVSMAGQILGTPFYMAPEQWGDHDVDERCDIYSLGATLYHVTTGQVPFAGARPMTVLHRMLEGRFPPPRELAPEVPVDLELVILRMMARERRCRYSTAAACAEDLERVLAGQPVLVPRLTEVKGGTRHALLPGTSFVIGRGVGCEVRLDDPSVAERHAAIELGPSGFVLRDLGAGTVVSGMRVDEVLLRPGDEVRLGGVSLRFDDPGIEAAPAAEDDRARLRVRPIPDPILDALVERGDRRVVLALIERVPAEAVDARVDAARGMLRDLVGGELAERACAAYGEALRAQRTRAIDRLFKITRENLGDDLAAWLAWWTRAARVHPPQLDQRLLVRDEGSRFGTRLNGRAVSSAFVRRGDRLALAGVEIVVEGDDWDADPPRAADGARLVDVALFDALVALRHPSTAQGLARFAGAPAHLGWVELATRTFEPDTARALRLAEAVRETFLARAAAALEVLPLLVRPVPSGDWSVAVARAPGLPPQIEPIAWFPEARPIPAVVKNLDDGASKN